MVSSSCTRSVMTSSFHPKWNLSGSARVAPTVIRGLSDAYGSWKTIWNRRRIFDSSLPDVFVSDWPSKRTSPDVGSMRSRSMRPVVDLPHPDSPTSPSVSRRFTVEGDAGHGGHRADRASEDAAPDREVLDEVGGDQQRLVAVHGRGARRGRHLGHASASSALIGSTSTSTSLAPTSSATSTSARRLSTLTPSRVSA